MLAALSGMERKYIRDRTLEGHESARTRGKAIGGAAVIDDAMLSMALHLREQNLSLREIGALRAGSAFTRRPRRWRPDRVVRGWRRGQVREDEAVGAVDEVRVLERGEPGDVLVQHAANTFLLPVGISIIGVGASMLVGAALCALGALVSHALAPETTGQTLTRASATAHKTATAPA
jgi:hypothetical protein